MPTRPHIHVVAAVIHDSQSRIFATQRGYGPFKDQWEFPGGKIETGETPGQALHREIHEELNTDIVIERLIDTIEYDYPEFHLTMQCYWCRLANNHIRLLEHEDARWLAPDKLLSVDWLPADISLIHNIKHIITNPT